VLPSISRGLAPEIGGGGIREALKAAGRTAIPSAVGGATEFAVLDPAGAEQDPLNTLIMGALLGQGKTVGEAGRGSVMGRIGERVIPQSTPLEDLGPAGLQEGNVLNFRKGQSPNDLLRNLTDEELAAQPLGSTPEVGASNAAPGIQEGQIGDIFCKPRTERRGAQTPFEEDFQLRQPFDRRIPAPERVTVSEGLPAPESPVVEPRQDVKGYDLASQIDREIGGGREDLARVRTARIQRQLAEARDKRNALLLREHSTDLPEPQHEELLAMESHIESLLRDLENARESLRGGSARTGAPFRALQAAQERLGRPKRKR
jgi:hypothetical protein